MRIISDGKDYYDCVQSFGQDMTLAYVRNPEEIYLKQGEWKFPSLVGSIPLWGSTCVIGFCGNIYPMIQMCTGEGTVKCFSLEDVDTFLQCTLKKKEWEKYITKSKYKFWKCNREKAFEFFEKCKKLKSSFKQMFDDKQCPVFVAEQSWSTRTITYNPLLRHYEFFRVFDTYTAFQEIAMFLSNYAVPQKPMPVIPNELKLRSKGFTDQSFRAPFKDPKRIPK